MPTVETVLGPVEADQLGRTLPHEHCRFRDEATAVQWPDRYDEDALYQAALDQVNAAKGHGVRTIVEPTAMFGGRDVPFLQRVSQATGMQLVACTGIYTYEFLPHYWENRDVDLIADHFVHDLEVGVQGTDAKAGFIKCAADEPGITPNVEKLHRAAARASLRTGAPIMAHSRPASGTGPLQLAIFLEEGVPAERIQIAHCGDTDDVAYIEGLLEQGVYVGLDRYGLPMYLPTDKRNATTAELLRRGWAEQLMLSQDHCASIDWFTLEAQEQLVAAGAIDGWSMTLIFERVLPWLREQGVMDDAVETTLFEANPRRWLLAGREG